VQGCAVIDNRGAEDVDTMILPLDIVGSDLVHMQVLCSLLCYTKSVRRRIGAVGTGIFVMPPRYLLRE
jgi:hypothetical protein